jgi:hypothetical protein
MALLSTVSAKYWAYCLPSNVFLSIPGTVLWEPPYLIHGFAFHHHGRMLALLSALQLLSLHFRHDTMGLTVLEPWLCAYHHHSKMLGLLAALHFFLCITGTILWDLLYWSHGFACHCHSKRLGLLSSLQSLHSRHDTTGITKLPINKSAAQFGWKL